MDRILKIAKREYVESVKSKTFIISVLFAPLIFGVVIFFTGRMSGLGKGGAAASSGRIYRPFRETLGAGNQCHLMSITSWPQAGSSKYNWQRRI